MSSKYNLKNIPTFSELGFDDCCKKSWPFHPFSHLLMTHMENDFAQFRIVTLDRRIPHKDALKKSFWDNKFKSFVNKRVKSKRIPIPVSTTSEGMFLEISPELQKKWVEGKTEYVKKVLSGQFGPKKSCFVKYLQYKWIVSRKRDYMKRRLGLKREWRTNGGKVELQIRKKYFAYYCQSLVYCGHRECWGKRLWCYPILIFVWFLLQLYGHFFDIFSLQSNRKKNEPLMANNDEDGQQVLPEEANNDIDFSDQEVNQ